MKTIMTRISKLIMAAGLLVTFAGCSTPKTAEFGEVKNICELATMKCYFHNVAKVDQKGEGIFAWTSYGNKKIWMEYTTQVELGIDASQVSIEKPDAKNVVKITVPSAKILTTYTDPDSFEDPLVEAGFLTTVTAADKTTVFNQGQSELENDINANTQLMEQAKDRAKAVIQGYVENVGRQLGQTYTIEWIDA